MDNILSNHRPSVGQYATTFSRLILMMMFALAMKTAEAKVVRVVVEKRVLLANGHFFGNVGQYEKIRGTIHYEVDPEKPASAAIVDLEFAPKNVRGMVEFSGDFMLLIPLDMSKANGRLVYEVNNRGRIFTFASLNGGQLTNNPQTLEQAGDGFLLHQGYSLLFSGWNWDVTEGDDRFQFEVPYAKDGEQSIRQKIAAEIVNNMSLKALQTMPLAKQSRGYPSANYPNNNRDVLTVRDTPEGKRTIIPNDQWSYSSQKGDEIFVDSLSLYFKNGFQPGEIYELIYEVKNPKVAGLGFAAVRDILSFFKYEYEDAFGFHNPLIAETELGKELAIKYTYVFGYSQPARFIAHMLMQGFHVDEKERMVFDGARIHVAGGGKGGFNSRFVQTTHHPLDLQGNYMPADYPPFNFLADDDLGSGGENDVLAVAKKLGKMPKILITNSALEYWNRSASLVHTTIDGSKDASVHKNVRIYLINGAPHGPTPRRYLEVAQHSLSIIDSGPLLRSFLIMMDDWVTKEIEPADSRYPRIDRDELITAAEHKQLMPAIPGMRHPGRNFQPPICDYGPEFWNKGIMSNIPPVVIGHYPTLVPAVDKDGNGIGGIRLPDITVPLGTYQGFNPRRNEANAPNYMTSFFGSFWPLASTQAERESSGDSRLSLEERYDGKESYVKNVIIETNKLLGDGLLTQEDADRIIADAKAKIWPPVMLETWPFWK
ncbi:alpha/beta hydrolase domain-containing protein [Algoriphagus sp. C2-6-M1]|uniref:alpha/beta hydrolase domain-containing protein n=1 Tax=Algoriphagus persicinus TaxID=3108754 RepID=UPI002B3C47CA|nr:alpha/beta hydrolase domain-containing protein [Algoriphagus sp. C2-6-M1]MEB2782346.1 alpha/beta hydrolase domain-containing protein [Algoriphagus sp. C2-6-M1]